jgi:chromosome partitioning protein
LRVITVLNRKGGVGKSTTAFNLGGTLAARRGLRVLLLDNDEQHSLTNAFLGPAAADALPASGTLASAYASAESGGGPMLPALVRPAGIPGLDPGLDLVAGSEALADYNRSSPAACPAAMQRCLRDLLADDRGRYDVAIIDCPPNLHLLSWAALLAADSLLVPVQPEEFGSQGVPKVLEFADAARAINPRLGPPDLVFNRVGSRKSVHKFYQGTGREEHGGDVLRAVIPDLVAFVEANGARKPVCLYDPKSAAASAIDAVADELLSRWEVAA